MSAPTGRSLRRARAVSRSGRGLSGIFMDENASSPWYMSPAFSCSIHAYDTVAPYHTKTALGELGQLRETIRPLSQKSRRDDRRP